MTRFSIRRWTMAASLMVALGIATSAYAHHSSAGADTTKSITVEGVVKQFKWANPHSWIQLEVINSKGVAEQWDFEMTSPAILVGAGWKATTIKAGEKVKVTARPLKSGEPGGLFVSVTLPSGQVLGQQAPPASAARPANP
jgi:hypothetical protein